MLNAQIEKKKNSNEQVFFNANYLYFNQKN